MARNNAALKQEEASPSPDANGTSSNGAAAESDAKLGGLQQIDPALLEKIAGIRSKIHETFGKVAFAFATSPRHRHLSLGDLLPLVFDPLLHDRVAIAQAAKANGKIGEGSMAGIAIWASVSELADARIREQIKAGVFPVRLKPDEWTSGKINWLLDLVAPSPQHATAVIANFKQVVKDGELRIHPHISSMLDGETLKKMGVMAGPATAQASVPENA